MGRLQENYDKFVAKAPLFMSPKGMFRIVADDMIKNRKDPLGKDESEWFKKVYKMLRTILKDSKINKLYTDVGNSNESQSAN